MDIGGIYLSVLVWIVRRGNFIYSVLIGSIFLVFVLRNICRVGMFFRGYFYIIFFFSYSLLFREMYKFK